MEIKSVSCPSRELEQVVELWRPHSGTLGFFPRGAFEEYAARGRIIGCFLEGKLAGYTAFRAGPRWVSIAHLCVSPQYRGKGVARALVDELARRTRDRDGIQLRCRRDFDVSTLWPKVGFIRVKETPARGGDGLFLVHWSRSNHNDDLVSMAETPSAGINAAVDANVFFALTEEDKATDETRALKADWLDDQVTLRVTEEIFNEIGRSDDLAIRDRATRNAQAFGFLRCKPQAFDNAFSAVRPLFAEKLSDSSESDVRQLARAIGGRADVFLTYDEKLLEKADAIYEKSCGLRVLKPVDLIIDLDSVMREVEYRPSRYRETGLSRAKISGDLDAEASAFVSTGERMRDLATKLRVSLSSPQMHDVGGISRGDERLALSALDRTTPSVLEISLLRTHKGSLSKSLSRSMIADALFTASEEGRQSVVVSDGHLGDDAIAALEELHFARSGNSFRRLVLTGCTPFATLDAPPEALTAGQVSRAKEIAEVIAHIGERHPRSSIEFSAAIERSLWPLKIADAALPTYVIPIRQTWAERLLDPKLGHPKLFGTALVDAMRLECVYYSATALPMSAPARIVWYVSGDGAQQAWGCSLLEEVVIDEPKAMFRRFRRLGVYDWRDVKNSTRPDGRLVALRFSGTEIFQRPIKHADLRAMFPDETRANFVGPLAMTPDAFIKIYRAAK